MMPPTLLCLLSMLCWTAVSPFSETPETCRHHPEAATLKKSWPVLAAVKVPPMTDASLRLSLSHKNHTHTNLTLAYRNKVNDALLVEVVVESEELQTKTSLMALLIPEAWSILKLNLHKTRFTVVVVGSSHSYNYTSRAEAEFLHHLVVDTVSSSSEPKQLIDVDLMCLYSECLEHGESPGESGRRHSETEESSSGHGTPAWPFFLVFFLLLIVCLLFLAWRYQHNQIKLRRRLQAQIEAAMKRNSERRSRRGSSVASGSPEAREEVEGGRVSERVQYSTILVSYDGPCTTEDEPAPPPPARSSFITPNTRPASVWS
nr:uncharacterized protein LOC123767325 isoform X1 [Procambarus clarkii]